MKNFYFDTTSRLRRIFTEHCDLSAEQYEEIRTQLIYLVAGIQDGEPQADIENRMDYMRAIFEFLYNTKQTTLKEQYELNQLLDDVWDAAKNYMAKLALEKGTVL